MSATADSKKEVSDNISEAEADEEKTSTEDREIKKWMRTTKVLWDDSNHSQKPDAADFRALKTENEELKRKLNDMSRDLFAANGRLENIDRVTHDVLAMTESDACFADTENNLITIRTQLVNYQNTARSAALDRDALRAEVSDLHKQVSHLLEKTSAQHTALHDSELAHTHIVTQLNGELEESRQNSLDFVNRCTTLADKLTDVETTFTRKVQELESQLSVTRQELIASQNKRDAASRAADELRTELAAAGTKARRLLRSLDLHPAADDAAGAGRLTDVLDHASSLLHGRRMRHTSLPNRPSLSLGNPVPPINVVPSVTSPRASVARSSRSRTVSVYESPVMSPRTSVTNQAKVKATIGLGAMWNPRESIGREQATNSPPDVMTSDDRLPPTALRNQPIKNTDRGRNIRTGPMGIRLSNSGSGSGNGTPLVVRRVTSPQVKVKARTSCTSSPIPIPEQEPVTDSEVQSPRTCDLSPVTDDNLSPVPVSDDDLRTAWLSRQEF